MRVLADFGFITPQSQENTMPTKPVPDKVSIGLSSVLGSLGVLGAAALAVISFVNGDQSSETIGAMAAGVAVLVGLMHVRGKQAVALTEAAAKKPAVLDLRPKPSTESAVVPMSNEELEAAIAPKPRVRKPKAPPAP